VPIALGVEHFVQTRGLRAKAALLAREVAPTPAFMRWWTPLARRGKLGLALSYPWRVVWFLEHLLPALRAWRQARYEARMPGVAAEHESVRVAWIGPTPGDSGGAQYVGTQLLHELAAAGVEVDCFIAAPIDDVPRTLIGRPGLRFICVSSGWEWGRWYSRGSLRSFFSGNLARAATQFRLAELILKRHRARPYDVVYQFSQSEIFPLRLRRRKLPPIVVHPSTHAAGELLWHRREAALSRRCERPAKRWIARAMLAARASIQRRDLRVADRVLAVSERFGEHLARDYEIPSERLGVVVNPIDFERFQLRAGTPPTHPVTFLFVSRISARKGVEMVVELSHRVSDLAGKVRIVAVGGATTWSDYRPLMEDLNPETAIFNGALSPAQLGRLYGRAHALLQPSLYEPFGLTVGEALATGLPVIASDEVGAIKGIDKEVCSVFPAGDMDAFEATVREMVRRVEAGMNGEVAKLARAEAERLFSPDRVARSLIDELERAFGRSVGGSRSASPRADDVFQEVA
jgi:glycosyltransferase involved in cell wall biosynthesis